MDDTSYFLFACSYVLCCEMFKQVISFYHLCCKQLFLHQPLSSFSLLKLTIKKCWSHNWETAKRKVLCLEDVSVPQNLLAVTKASKLRLVHLTLRNFVRAENFTISSIWHFSLLMAPFYSFLIRLKWCEASAIQVYVRLVRSDNVLKWAH